MAIFDASAAAPLPNFDMELPKVNTESFLPNFDLGGDLFGNLPDFSVGNMFGGFTNSRGFESPSFYTGSYGGSSFSNMAAFRSMLPQYGQTPPFRAIRFPWDKPPELDFSGLSGGVGMAPGDYAVLDQYNSAFLAAAARFGGGQFDANWLKAMAMMEGGWGAGSTSGAGALGIMQIMPGGYPSGEAMFPNWKSDPTQNIMLGAYILSEKIKDAGGRDGGTMAYLGTGTDPYTGVTVEQYLANIKNFYGQLQSTTNYGGTGEKFTGTAGSSYLSVFGGVNYPVSSQHAQRNGAPESWYYAIDDELGIPVGTHAGLDVAMPEGTKLFMPSGLTGQVTRATGEFGYGYDPGGGVGRSGPGTGELRIEGRDAQGREFMMIFGHMQRINWQVGQTVTAGMLLGLSGTAGSGAHVHFEYRIRGNTPSGWQAVDPRLYLR